MINSYVVSDLMFKSASKMWDFYIIFSPLMRLLIMLLIALQRLFWGEEKKDLLSNVFMRLFWIMKICIWLEIF